MRSRDSFTGRMSACLLYTSNLFSRMVYMRNSLRIPLSELDYAPSPDEEGYIVIDPQSLQNAISVHYSDVKVVAVRNIPPIKLPVEE